MALENDAKIACENVLRKPREYNVERKILPSENVVIDRLLSRGTELRNVYSELYDKLGPYSPALEVFLGAVVSAAAFRNPERLKIARGQKTRLQLINEEIAIRSAELVELLDEQSKLENSTSFGSDTHYHIVNVIVEAASDNSYFQLYVKDELELLSAQTALKYWPTLSDFMNVITNDAFVAEVETRDQIPEASIASKRSSFADFIRALLSAVDENSKQNCGMLPLNFKIGDESLASLTNCALDLTPEKIVDGAYVKRLRQRNREMAVPKPRSK